MFSDINCGNCTLRFFRNLTTSMSGESQLLLHIQPLTVLMSGADQWVKLQYNQLPVVFRTQVHTCPFHLTRCIFASRVSFSASLINSHSLKTAAIQSALNVTADVFSTCCLWVSERVEGTSPAPVRLTPGPHRSCKQAEEKQQALRLFMFCPSVYVVLSLFPQESFS